MPKILLVTHFFPEHGGGIETVAGALAANLARDHDWKIVWFASDTDAPPTNQPPRVQCIPARAWNGIERNIGVPWPVWSLGALWQLWRVIGQADAVHLHDALYFGNAFTWLFARLRGVPVIVTQHTGRIPFCSVLLRAIHTFASHTLGRLVLSTAHQTVFISPAVRQEFERFCRFRAPPVYFPNGVDTIIYTPDGPTADDPAIECAYRAGKRVLLFVGRFLEKKGLNILRELATAFPDDLWIFAGWGPIDPAQWALPNVLVVRGVTGAGLARYYRAANLLVLPSFSEGFPLVVQESMACGTPVMVGEDSAAGCPNASHLMLVENVGTGDTTARWALRLSELRENPHRLRALRSEVADFAHRTWSWKTCAEDYANIINQIVAPGGEIP